MWALSELFPAAYIDWPALIVGHNGIKSYCQYQKSVTSITVSIDVQYRLASTGDRSPFEADNALRERLFAMILTSGIA